MRTLHRYQDGKTSGQLSPGDLDEEDLTPSEERALRTIGEFHAEHGYMPNGRTLAPILGVKTQRVYQLFEALERKGRISKRGALWHTLQIVRCD